MIRASRLHRYAVFALAAFVAMICVTVLAPFVGRTTQHAQELSAFGEVCSVHGSTASTAVDHSTPAPDPHDHTAHCPLCMPCGAPPAAFVLQVEPVQPLAHVRQSIPAARLASLVGAPLPARGPPSFA